VDIQAYKKIVGEILAGQRVTAPENLEYGAHYTRSHIPRILLSSPENNVMRQYDGDYMNDPEEGRYLIDVMLRAVKNSSHKHKEAFVERLGSLRRNRLLYSAYQQCTFLSCWTTTKLKPEEVSEGDSLNHWRFYGDDAKGSCVMVPMAHLAEIFPDCLYRVIYGTEARGGGRSAATRPVKLLEDAVVKRVDSLRQTESNALADLDELIQATHPLLFLFKSSSYAAEKEVRSIVHKPTYAIDDGVSFDEREPARAYTTSKSGLISDGSIIFFGPKSSEDYAIEVMGQAANQGISLQAFVSSKPYR
jgi:hypothetical protein